MPLAANTWLRCQLVVFLLLSVAWAADDAKAGKAAPLPAKTQPAQVAPVTAPKAEPAPVTEPAPAVVDEDDENAAEKKEAEDTAKVARPVSSDLVQIYGWREKVRVGNMTDLMVAKLDSGATTSSLHAEDQQVFERDGKKWVKFVITDPNQKGAKRYEMEAPLTRTVSIKEPGGTSERRNVVRLRASASRLGTSWFK